MSTVTILGAGGKMGYRISTNLAASGHTLRHVEVSEAGRKRLAEAGITCVTAEEALAGSDVVVLCLRTTAVVKSPGAR